MNLVADIGNTRSKLGVFVDDKLIANITIEKGSDSNILEDFLNPLKEVRNILTSSVGNEQLNISSFYPNALVMELDSSTPLPITLAYSTPDTLGADRIAISVGANNQFRNENVLVIDLGTCITFDFINSKNEYQGGSISPSTSLRYKALNNYTENLPLVVADIPLEQIMLQGKSTKESIMTGVTRGVFYEITGLINRYFEEFPELKVMFTGGSFPYFENELRRTFQSKKNLIFADSYLALTGLNVIVNFNVNR
ncbi:MAG: pantothenate kinase [Bacteroidetes bacterium]|nr:MAG: pantothenate kinase [Bacteroidota bacterium]